MSRDNILRSLASGFGMLALAACAGDFAAGSGSGSLPVGPSGAAGGTPTSLQAQENCRQHVDQTFDKQNRPTIYAANPSVNTPFSANYDPTVANRNLSNQFAYEQSVAACEHGGIASDRNDVLPVTTPPNTTSVR